MELGAKAGGATLSAKGCRHQRLETGLERTFPLGPQKKST